MEGVDFDESFAPIARLKSICILMSIACTMNFKLYQMDVKCAFLNGYLNEEVFVEQPKGFQDPHFPDHMLRLKKALYGLKQTPRAWYDQLTHYLLDRGFKRGYADRTLFVKNDDDYLLMTQVYVDDIVFGATTDARAIDFSKEMKNEFEMSMVGELTASTPMSSSTKLNLDPSGVEVSPTLYRSIIGSLLYLTTSRPDIAFSVGVCARYQATLKESHLTAMKRIIRYVNGTPDYGLYSKDSNACLVGYSDVDWAGSVDDQKSTSSGYFYLGNNLVSWMSKKQNSMSLFTTKEEYIATGSCCTQLL